MITYTDGTIVKGSGPEIYVIEAGNRRWISNPIIFIIKGYDWNKMHFIADHDLEDIPLGPGINIDEIMPTWFEVDRLLESRRRLLKNEEEINLLSL